MPIHFSTTFRCTPHFVIYSDLEESLNGHRIYDALDEVNATIQATNPDFELYRQMHELNASGDAIPESMGADKKAWKLDKWKFLPLMDKALRTRPQAKWFVFVEADTYLVWSNLLLWLARFDPDRPLYIGGQSVIGDQEFAHGGTGFIISQPALVKITQNRADKIAAFDDLTAKEWAGDFVLAKAFRAVGMGLTASWPILQGETPFTLDYTGHHWCFPVVSYHHMDAAWIERMWEFEQSWIGEAVGSSFFLVAPIVTSYFSSLEPLLTKQHPQSEQVREPIRHRDVFDHFVAPPISAAPEKTAWHNLSPDAEPDFSPDTPDGCRAACRARDDCLQYLYSPGKCQTSKVVRLGAATDDDGVTSGWMEDRIKAFRERMEPCTRDWIVTGKG